MGIQASRSFVSWTISSHTPVLCGVVQGQVAQTGRAGGPDPVFGPGPQPVTELQCGDRPVRGVGRETSDPHAVRVGDPQLGARVRPFLADDQPHPLRPAVEQVTGEFGDPGPVADSAAGLDGRGPGGSGDLQHVAVNGLGDHHADGAGEPASAPGEPGDELVGAAREVAVDEGLPSTPVFPGQLGEGETGGGDVVGGGVRARVPGAE
jgi:hypothetical protein